MRSMKKDVSNKKNYRMSQIKSKNTRLEKKVFNALEENQIAFSKHDNKLPGKPDIVIKEPKIAIFIDSDFWHGWKLKEWKHKLSLYWLNKITNNLKRDKTNDRKLKKLGWEVIRIQEHQIDKNIIKYIKRIKKLSN